MRENGDDWLRYGDSFPNVRTVELKINYCVGKLRAATFGRGAWEADLLPASEDLNLHTFRIISSDETWNTDKNMTRHIRVKSGATLTLEDMTLGMPKDGLIIVEQGAELKVNNATITNLCGEMWQGIQVWGNNMHEQSLTYQGRVTLTGATISYAVGAIRQWKVGDLITTGGIVKALNTNFINNKRSFEFMRYRSPSNQVEQSRITACTFNVDGDFRTINGEFLGHISAWDISALKINGSTFKDERNNKNIGANGRNYGIGTISASVQLKPYIVYSHGGSQIDAVTQNTFEGLENAIVLNNPSANPYTSIIDQCNFVNNGRAVTLNSHPDARIIRNNFEIGGFDNLSNEYGVKLFNCHRFTLEQNSFQGDRSITSNANTHTGLIVINSNHAPNQIFNNTFENLSTAQEILGANGIIGTGKNPGSGLQFLCNEHTNNRFDIVIDRYYMSGGSILGMVAPYQGSHNQPASNTFSNPLSSSLGNNAHINNAGFSGINYFYNSSNASENPTVTQNVNAISSNNTGSPGFCADNFSTTLTEDAATDNKGNLLNLNQLLNNIQQQQLLQKKLAEKSVQKQHKKTPKKVTKSSSNTEQVQNSIQLTASINELTYRLRNNRLTPNADSIINCINMKTGLAPKYELAEYLWQQKEYTKSIQSLEEISFKYELSKSEQLAHDNLIKLKHALYQNYKAGRSDYNLDKATITLFQEIAKGQGETATQVVNILNFFYDGKYEFNTNHIKLKKQ